LEIALLIYRSKPKLKLHRFISATAQPGCGKENTSAETLALGLRRLAILPYYKRISFLLFLMHLSYFDRLF
jgi:hypothetical protein